MVPYIPHQKVIGRVEYIMKRYCEFYYAQTSTKMSAGARYDIYEFPAQFICELTKFRSVQLS